MISETTVNSVIGELLDLHGHTEAERLERCVSQTVRLWRPEDGDDNAFHSFCLDFFIPQGEEIEHMLDRYEYFFEQIDGRLHEIQRLLRAKLDVEKGKIQPYDLLIGRMNPSAHLLEDLFHSKIAFSILLNFPIHSLDEMLIEGPSWSREKWAMARLAQRFSKRIPAEVKQGIHEAFVNADSYINQYNIHMHHLMTRSGDRPFPEGLRLISHWGLRDELKSQYGDAKGFQKQRLIQMVMERIIRQEIPAAVVNSPDLDWTPETNAVIPTSRADLAAGSGNKTGAPGKPEENTRYARLLEVFHAVSSADPYSPLLPTYITRRFEEDREISEAEVENLLVSLLQSREAEGVARLIQKRLGRPLEPFDIWYNGFTVRTRYSEAELDTLVRSRFPTVDSFQAAIPTILQDLGFSESTAGFLGNKIVVDPARGAGHAMGARRREDSAHLRTRIPGDGMNYKGFNIAIHELGHNVEQVFTLDRIDHTLLQGVPNTAFTEAFAFVFQDRDLALLGLEDVEPMFGHLKALDTFWSACEIGGVALVDMKVWRWLYDHPRSTPAELRDAVITISRNVWNRYFSSLMGHDDQILLGIYSHMIDAGLYLPDYPVGHIIAFQLERYLEGKNLAEEMERMCRQGAITPDAWMKGAVGTPISVEPLLEATRAALETMSGE